MTKDYFNKKNLIPIIAGDAESIFKGLKDSIKYRKSLIREGSKTVQFYNAKRYGLDHLKVYNQALNYYKKPIAINIPYKSKQPVIILYGEIDQEILQRYGNIMLEELHKVSSHIYYIYDLSPNKLLEKYNIFQIHKNLSIYEFARKSNAEIFITLKLSKLYYSSDMLLKYLKRFKINQYDCAEVENLPATQQCNFYSKTSLEFIDTQFYKIENLYKELSTVQKFNYGKFSIHVDFMNFASTAFNFLENNNLVNLFYEQERKNYNLMIQNALNIVNLNAITIYNNTPKDSYCFKRDVSDCNVLFINQVSEMGGAENSLYLLVKYLKRYKPIVWLPCDGTLAKMIKKLGHKVIIMPQNIFNFQQPQMLYSKQKELLDIINTHKISVIHSNSYKVANLSGMISTISGIPSITHQRDVILQPGHAINSGLHLNSKVVAVSEYIASNIKEKSLLGDDRISQIYNGVEIPSTINRSNNSYRELYHIPDDAIVIGYVGMTYTWKGTHIFVEVAKQITEKYKNVYAIIFGEPKINQSYWNYYNELKIKVFQSAVKDRIIFAGYREDKPNIYQCINILVHPSIEPDPMPRSVIEGMAYKCCVISSDIGGIPEEIGEKNLLVTPNNIRELYKKLQYLITHQEITEEYGNKLYQRCFQKFTIDEHVSKVVNLYDEVRRKS